MLIHFGVECDTHVGLKHGRVTWFHFYLVKHLMAIAIGGPWRYVPHFRFGAFK